MAVVRESVVVNGREISFETGAVARQANAALLVREGDTTLIAVVGADSKPTRLPYMPLTTEYRHKLAAAGKIPGSYNRREARPTDLEVLTSRMIDRSIRPFFPSTWCYDTQVILHPLSYDPNTDIPSLAITAAAAALNLSDVPWAVPLAAVRIVRVAGQLIAFPDHAQCAAADLDLVVSCARDGLVMVEGGGDEVAEDVVLEAFELARTAVAPLQALIDRLREAAGKPPRAAPEAPDTSELDAKIAAFASAPLEVAMQEGQKHARYAAIDAVKKDLYAHLEVADDDGDAKDQARERFDALKKTLIRAGIRAGTRLGGRTPDQIREITGRVDWLARCHGSSLFTRGETQAIVTCTLGTVRDAQRIETLDGEVRDGFLLHYNFPPWSVGEVRPLRGPGRREIGHGHLARRAILPLLPSEEAWPYTIRLESTITESNGSSSMATVCGGSMALLDAGVPLPRPVAGIAMGLVQEEGQIVVLSDILGDEDHVGDMDFKVAGTSEGVTAIQLDNKLGALPMEVMKKALEQARAGRVHILNEMAKVVSQPCAMNAHAPRVESVRIDPGRIGALIGPGGSTIKGIREATGVEIDVQDDGLVRLFADSGQGIAAAKERVADLTGLPKKGVTYQGRVVSVKDFGSFVRIFEGVEGLLFGEQLKLNSTVAIEVTGVNPKGKLEIARAPGA